MFISRQHMKQGIQENKHRNHRLEAFNASCSCNCCCRGYRCRGYSCRGYRCRGYRIFFNPINICFHIGVNPRKTMSGTTRAPRHYASQFSIANKRTTTIPTTKTFKLKIDMINLLGINGLGRNFIEITCPYAHISVVGSIVVVKFS